MARTIDADELRNQIKHMPRTANPDLVQYSLVQAIIANAPTLTPPNEWVSVEERLPELPKEKYCWVCVLGCRKSSKRCMPMFYERTVVRGKTVERWKDMWDRIANELPDYWMPLPEPPRHRPTEEEEDT